jgi:hypothetical protein
VGWTIALIIYLTADEIVESPLAEFEKTKRFTNGVERMGGKVSLVANDLSKWFSSLWYGETLAYTVIFATLILAVGYYLIASDPSTAEEWSDKE